MRPAAARQRVVHARLPVLREVPVASVVDVVERFAALGCDEIDIADTIGVGTPKRTREVLAAVTRVFPRERLSGHFHDTYGQAAREHLRGAVRRIEIFHASVAGLGGCPYAKGATGNVATEDVLYLMQGLGIDTGIDLAQVVAAGDFISNAIGRANVSRAGRALPPGAERGRRRELRMTPVFDGFLNMTTPASFDSPDSARRVALRCASAAMRKAS